MTRNGDPIQTVQLKFKLSTGIEIREIPGIIPTFYEIKACIASGYRYYHDWQELEEWQKAKLVGYYFVDNLVNASKDEVVQSKIEADAKKRKK